MSFAPQPLGEADSMVAFVIVIELMYNTSRVHHKRKHSFSHSELHHHTPYNSVGSGSSPSLVFPRLALKCRLLLLQNRKLFVLLTSFIVVIIVLMVSKFNHVMDNDKDLPSLHIESKDSNSIPWKIDEKDSSFQDKDSKISDSADLTWKNEKTGSDFGDFKDSKRDSSSADDSKSDHKDSHINQDLNSDKENGNLNNHQNEDSAKNQAHLHLTTSPVENHKDDSRSEKIALSDPKAWNYVLVIDAGSTGSRLHVIKYSGSEYRDVFMQKVRPGLSVFLNTPEEAYFGLRDLLNNTLDIIPESLQSETSLYIFATAGMRELPEKAVMLLMDAITVSIRRDFVYKFPDLHFQVIEGVFEAVYGWVTLNYLKADLHSTCRLPSPTYSMIEMGGGSVQVAFEEVLDNNSLNSVQNVRQFLVKLPNCGEVSVVVASFSGFGSISARTRYSSALLISNLTSDPCLLRGQQTQIIHPDSQESLVLPGDGDFTDCVNFIDRFNLLNKSRECHMKEKTHPCSLNGAVLPELNVSSFTTLIGLREFHFVPESLHKTYRTEQFTSEFPGRWNPNEFFTLAKSYCGSDWSSVQEELVTPKVLSSQDADSLCFRSAWTLKTIDAILHLQDDSTIYSLTQVAGQEISWALGAAILLTNGRLR